MDFLTKLPIAHRGLHGGAVPENSLAAFERALGAGYAIETDVRFTKDRQLAVFHDDRLKRMTGIDESVDACTMSEIGAMKLNGTEETVPSVHALLELVRGRVPLLIEIKNMRGVGAREIARALSEALKGYPGEYAVQSFQPFYVHAYKKLHPEIACGVLGTVLGGDGAVERFVAKRMPFNFLLRPDFVSYDLKGLLAGRTRSFRGPKLAWTVRSEEERALARTVADNIIFENFIPEDRMPGPSGSA